jgi:general secretion pathway protein A
MYREFYRLGEKPFSLTTDPFFLWIGKGQRKALADLSEGMERPGRLLLLLGRFGTGKTTLLNAFVRSLGRNVAVARLPDAAAGLSAFYEAVASEFGLGAPPGNELAFVNVMDVFGEELCSNRMEALLVVDEAHFMSPEMASHLHRLADMDWQGARPVHILLSGQEEASSLVRAARRSLLQPGSPVLCRLKPLDRRETHAYVRHRLSMAGGDPELFTPGAVAEVFALSRGLPRGINLLCDFSLLHGFHTRAGTIDPAVVRACVDRYQLGEILNPSEERPDPEPGGAAGPSPSRGPSGGLRRVLSRALSLF